MLLQVPLGLDSCEGPACKRARLAMGEHEVDLDMASMCLPLLGRSWCASSPDTVARAVAAEVGVFRLLLPTLVPGALRILVRRERCMRGCGCRGGSPLFCYRVLCSLVQGRHPAQQLPGHS